MKKIIVVLIVVAWSCTSSRNANQEQIIVGTWCLTTDEINYPTITFGPDSLASFGSKMDTVYTFRYYVENGMLNLVQPSTKVNKYKILKQTEDSLAFASLLEHNTIQAYYRCKK